MLVFAYGAVAPVLTLLGLYGSERPELSETETLRATGLVAIGTLGAIFIPDCVAFGLGSSDWWDRVSALHPSQQTLESSTSLFALFATEASMVAHRVGKAGVRAIFDDRACFRGGLLRFSHSPVRRGALLARRRRAPSSAFSDCFARVRPRGGGRSAKGENSAHPIVSWAPYAGAPGASYFDDAETASVASLPNFLTATKLSAPPSSSSRRAT